MNVIKRATRLIGNKLRPTTGTTQDFCGEQGPDFYNDRIEARRATLDPYHRSHYYFLWSIIVDRLRRSGFGRVLEIGCGPGRLGSFLLDQGLEHYVGVDFSDSAIRIAREREPRGRFVTDDARTTKIHAEYEHDVVICTEVLEHIEADLLVVSRFLPGKRCLCSVPNFEFDSHVRWFHDAAEVLARYGRFFDGPDVMTLKSPQSEHHLFFLLDGVRNQESFIN